MVTSLLSLGLRRHLEDLAKKERLLDSDELAQIHVAGVLLQLLWMSDLGEL